MDNKIVKVIFKEGWETMYNTDLTQVDFGQILQVEGVTLPDGNVEVHFSLTEHNGEAPIYIGKVKDKVITVDIPDFILQKKDVYTDSYQAYAWIYVTDGESGRTIRKIVFTIDTRAEPTTNVPEDQKDKFLQEVRQVMAETKEVAQSVRDDADNGKFSGIPGPPGKDGKNGEDGKDGDDGEDGKSAYQYAVEGGFKGTEQEFIDLMAQAGHVDITGYVTKEQHEAEILKTMVKVTTDKAPFHHITDSANYKVLDFGMEGITEQNTVSGNQLFDISSLTGFTVDGNTIVKSKNKTAYILPQEKALPNTQYYISFEVDTIYSNAMKNFNIYVTYTDGSMDDMYLSAIPNGMATNANKSVVSIRLRTMDYADEQKMSNLMINVGSTAKPWEPYTGGIPSPNSDYQQPITLAGVLNEETGRYEHRCCVGNKNIMSPFIYDGGLNYDNGSFNAATTTPTRKTTDFIYFDITKTYYLSIGASSIAIFGYDVNKEFVARTPSTVSSSKLFTKDNLSVALQDGKTQDDIVYIRCMVYLVDGSYDEQIQLEIADTSTDFTPHASQPFTLTSPQPLTKWDYKAKRDGLNGWSINHYKRVFDGTENWKEFDTDKIVLYDFEVLPIKHEHSEAIGSKSEHFREVDKLANITINTFVTCCSGGSTWTVFKVEMSVDDWKAYLAEQYANGTPVYIIYPTAEEQAFIPLPEEEQTLLHNLEMYYGVTNVYNEQGCPIWFKYCADQELHWNQKLLQIQQAII